MTLCRPLVVGPVSELTRAIRVRGQFPGATVSILSVGSNPRTILQGVATSSDERFDIPVGEALTAGDVLLAMQELDGEASRTPDSSLPLGVAVQPAPTATGALGYVSYLSNLWECGQHLWVRGGIPGAEAVINSGGATIGSGTFMEAEGSRPSIDPALGAGSVTAFQTVAGVGNGPGTSRVPASLPGSAGEDLPAPVIDPPPMSCQTAVRVSRVFDGADVVLVRSDGVTTTEERGGFDRSALWWPLDHALDQTETISIRQEVALECERGSRAEEMQVGPPGPVPAPSVGPVCEGVPLIAVSNLAPNATVELDIAGTVTRGQAPPDATTLSMIVDYLPAGTGTVRQEQCGVWGPPATLVVAPASGSSPTLDFPFPLFSCSNTVVIRTNSREAIAQASSARFGPISDFVSCAKDPTVIPIAPALTEADDIIVTIWACAGEEASATAAVENPPGLGAPEMDGPVYIGDSTVTLDGLVPGATVTIRVTDSDGNTIQLITLPATDKRQPVTLDPPLGHGDTVTARQALCESLSAQSQPQIATTVPIAPDWWRWVGANPRRENWNREYHVSGTFTNKGPTPIFDTHFTYWENTTSPGDLSPGQVDPGGSTNGAYATLKQDWSWLTPGLWIPRGPFAKTFKYRLDITGKDSQGTSYPVTSTIPVVIVVEVSSGKRFAASQAAAQTVVAVALGVAAAAALLGIFTALLAVPLGIAAAAAAGVATIAGAVALDPPEPDPNFQERVTMPLETTLDLGPNFPRLAALLGVLGDIQRIELAKMTIMSRLLGAAAAEDDGWVAIHRQDFEAATERQRLSAASAPRLETDAMAELGPIAAQLEPVYADIREDLLVSGLPLALGNQAGLSLEEREALDVPLRSTEVAYPSGDLLAALHESVTAMVSFVDSEES